MKRTHFFLLLAAVILAACGQGGYNEPTYPGGGGSTTPSGGGGTKPGGGSSETEQPAKADFTYIIQQPLIIEITDKSTGKKVDYDFGDGSATITHAPGSTFTYQYKKEGTYVIKAIAKDSKGGTNELHKSITIAKPQVYAVGIIYKKVDYDDRYYKFKLNDDGPIIIKTWVSSLWSEMLYTAILPYTFKLKTPVLLEHPDKYTYYTLYVHQSTKASGDGTQCLKQDILSKRILSYPEYIDVSNNSGNTQVRLLFEYK